jgi:YVTN family beta-propeller protein
MSLNLNAGGDVNVGGDVVGRDKIVNNIGTLIERALTAAEQADQEKSLEAKYLAEGVRDFAQRLQARASEPSEVSGSPYKGLLEYRLNDAEMFFGRSQAITDILEHLERGSLTILHAESGAGKTSLIQAGLFPRLINSGHLPVYLRPYNIEPSLALKRAFLPDPSATPMLATALLRDFLRQVTTVLGGEEGAGLHIFIDQFEEFFTQLEESGRTEFIHELADCLDDDSLHVHWCLSMRTEFFGNLANFRPRIRNPFENDFRLNRLNLTEAREVAVEPAKRRGITFEDSLVDLLLTDLGQGEIAPPEIQLVCSALYEELPTGQTTITRALYTAQGGTAGILRNHLERVLNRNFSTEEREVAQRILEGLVSADGRRMIRPLSKLLEEINASRPQPITLAQLDKVLGQLVDSHLLRAHGASASTAAGFETASGLSYELTHDYLVSQIKIDPASQARKAAQELLDQEVKKFERYGTLLSDEDLAILAPRRAALTLSDSARKLLTQSETALKRKRGFLLGGIGLVIVLVVLALASIGSSLVAEQQRQSAEVGFQTAQVEVTQAALQKNQAEADAKDALHRDATSEAAAGIAATREAHANIVVRNLFTNNGLVPLSGSPAAFVFDGSRLWVSNQGNPTVQIIDPTTGIVSRTIEIGHSPGALAFDGQRVWVADQADNRVRALDPATGKIVAEAKTGNRPSALLFDGERLWIANYSDNTVQALDPETQTSHTPITVGAGPLALVYAARRVWVANRNANSVSVIDPELNQIALPEVKVNSVPTGLAYDGNLLWVTSQFNGTLQTINPSNGTLTSFDVKVGLRPSAVISDGVQLWVANEGENTVVAVNPTTGVLSAPIKVGTLPRALGFTDKSVWVANYSDNTAQAIDPKSGKVAASISVGKTPRGMAFDGQRLWVANSGSGTIQAIDPTTSAVQTPITVGAGVRDLAFDGSLLWVVNQNDNTVQSVDPATGQTGAPLTVGNSPRVIIYAGEKLWIINQNDGTVQSLDPTTSTLGAPIKVGNGPFDLAYDGHRLWVVNNTDSTVQSLNPDTGRVGVPILVGSGAGTLEFADQHIWVTNFNEDTLQAIDIEANKVVTTVQVGAFPAGLTFDGENLWVVNFGDNTVEAVDPTTGQLVAHPVHVGASPTGVLFDGKRLWISSRDSNAVQYILIR